MWLAWPRGWVQLMLTGVARFCASDVRAARSSYSFPLGRILFHGHRPGSSPSLPSILLPLCQIRKLRPQPRAQSVMELRSELVSELSLCPSGVRATLAFAPRLCLPWSWDQGCRVFSVMERRRRK